MRRTSAGMMGLPLQGGCGEWFGSAFVRVEVKAKPRWCWGRRRLRLQCRASPAVDPESKFGS